MKHCDVPNLRSLARGRVRCFESFLMAYQQARQHKRPCDGIFLLYALAELFTTEETFGFSLRPTRMNVITSLRRQKIIENIYNIDEGDASKVHHNLLYAGEQFCIE